MSKPTTTMSKSTSTFKVKAFKLTSEFISEFIKWEIIESESMVQAVWTVYNGRIKNLLEQKLVLNDFAIEVSTDDDAIYGIAFVFQIKEDCKINIKASFVRNLVRYIKNVPQLNMSSEADIYNAIQ